MPGRTVKQLVYGGSFVAAVFVFTFGFYILFVKPSPTCFDAQRNQKEEEVDCGGPCIPCEIKRLKKIQAIAVRLFNADKGALSVLAEFRNPNLRYGAREFSYDLVLYNAAGEEVFSEPRHSFIYPGEIKYLVEIGLPMNPRTVVRGEARVGDAQWEPSERFPAPRFETRELAVEQKKELEQAIVSGVLTNRNSFPVEHATLVVMVMSRLGLVSGISSTRIEDLGPQGTRFFRVVVPGIVADEEVHEGSVKIYVDAAR